MSRQHHFNVDAAVEVGVNAAILLEQFEYWINKNRANRTHFYDGRYWTYNSVRAFEEIYPYFSKKVIRTALRKLEDEGYIVVGDYGPDRMSRPNWYAITEKGYALLNGTTFPKGTNELPYRATRTASEGNSLYLYNSSSSTDSSSLSQEGEVAQRDNSDEAIRAVIDHLNQTAGTKYTYRSKRTNKLIKARLKEGFTVEDFKTVIDTKVAQWGNNADMAKYLRPSTLFAEGHFEEYLHEPTRANSTPVTFDTSEWQYEYRGGDYGAA